MIDASVVRGIPRAAHLARYPISSEEGREST